MAKLSRAVVTGEVPDVVGARKQILDSINPEAFRAWAEEYCQRRIDAGDASFAGLELPPPPSEGQIPDLHAPPSPSDAKAASTRIIDAVVTICGKAPSESGFSLLSGLTSISEVAHDETSWMFAPLAAKIGFPLKISLSKGRNSHAAPGLNYSLAPLFYRPNPAAKDLGLSSLPHSDRDMVVVRCDGGELRCAHVQDIERFLMQQVMELKKPAWEKMTEDKKKAQIAKTLSPKEFKEFFEKLCKQQSEMGNLLFEGVSLPPLSEAKKYCEYCGAGEKKGDPSFQHVEDARR